MLSFFFQPVSRFHHGRLATAVAKSVEFDVFVGGGRANRSACDSPPVEGSRALPRADFTRRSAVPFARSRASKPAEQLAKSLEIGSAKQAVDRRRLFNDVLTST
jgi:hypothetical protein